uniref:Putative rna polymerase ii transcription elongation factor elongin/siii subunit elongin a n=1 Tax=Nyssomyia neivai TaxID=330878 RepID=A0A1L8DH63_9DIPT
MSSVREVVVHYQKKIERSTDKKQQLHCIEKLYKLPVTIEHLQETGVGKTVNNLRKEEGEVKVAARALVAKWKAMVAQAELENSTLVETPRGDSNSDCDQSPPQGDSQYDAPEDASKKVEKSSSSSSRKDHHKSHSSQHHREHHRDDVESSSSHKSHHREHREHKEHKSDHKSKRHHTEMSNKCDSNQKSHSRSEHKKEKKDKHREKHRDHSTKRDDKEENTVKSRDSRHAERAERKEKSRKRQKTPSDGDTDGSIDNSQGTSFADALSMLSDVPQKKSTPKKRRTSDVSSTWTATSAIADSSMGGSEKKQKVSVKQVAVVKPLGPPDLLKSPEKLSPLDPEIIKGEHFELPPIAIPQITSNYRPMPLNPAVMECVFPTAGCSKQKPIATFHMTDEEAMGTSMQSKNLRTKVYSGIKTGAIYQVPSLHELCIRILQKNIDALEYTGGVPFDILKPVIERASPEQLFNFEHFNPYLMEDTDELWQQHCKRRFKSEKRQEMESWREMYLRCLDEQEARFNNLTQNIKQSQTTAIPVRKTQLAYVDNFVKPPRGVQRKQNQFGTRGKVTATPAARVAALSGIRNIAKPGDARLRIAPVNREYDPASSSSAVKPKRAPLMQKSLMLFKGRLKK